MLSVGRQYVITGKKPSSYREWGCKRVKRRLFLDKTETLFVGNKGLVTKKGGSLHCLLLRYFKLDIRCIIYLRRYYIKIRKSSFWADLFITVIIPHVKIQKVPRILPDYKQHTRHFTLL